MLELKHLFIYPVKSMRGISLSKVECLESGFALDRKFMLVDLKENKFITLREKPELARIELKMNDEKIIMALGEKKISFDINNLSNTHEVQVWKDKVSALRVNSLECEEFLSEILNKKVMIVSSNNKRAGKNLRFQDSMPVHLVNMQSVADLAQKCGEDIRFDRFRPNMVIDGLQAYKEDEIDELKFSGGLRLKKTTKTSRCKIIGTDQQTGFVDLVPLQTLVKTRREGNGVVFGIHFEVITPGVISVGERSVE